MSNLRPLADNPLIIAGAYGCAIIPWGLLYAFDFITDRWRPIRKTRREGLVHLFIYIPPTAYVVFYAYLQGLGPAADYKEMMAAVLALVFCIFHVSRTVWGLLQLEVYQRWCDDALECMKILDSDLNVKDGLDNLIHINNKIVDNEVNGTDLGVALSFKKIRYHLNPLEWIITKKGLLCSVRWAGSFLCVHGDSYARKLGKTSLEKLFEIAHSSLESFFHITLLLKLEKGSPKRLFSIGQLFSNLSKSKLRHGAYGMDIENYRPNYSLRLYANEIRNIMSSYPTINEKYNKNRDCMEVHLVESLLIAKHLGVET